MTYGVAALYAAGVPACNVAPCVWNLMYWSPTSSTIVCVVLYVNGINRARLVLSLTSATKAVPGRFSAGPCGVAMKFRILAAPVWNLTSSMRPNISGDSSPPANDLL